MKTSLDSLVTEPALPRAGAFRLRVLLMSSMLTLLWGGLLRADFWEDWNQKSDPNGWYTFVDPDPPHQPLAWLADHGVDNTAFVYCHLDALAVHPDTGAALFPLWTFGWTNADSAAHPVNALCAPCVTLALNPAPLAHQGPPRPLPANLQGGELRFFVGQWNVPDNYAFYVYKAASFAVGSGGWTNSTVATDFNEASWDLYAPSQAAGLLPPLETVLEHPQQWGFAILGPNSPCIDAGSTTLRLGYGYLAADGAPVFDKGTLDLGFHPPLGVLPGLLITHVAGAAVKVSAEKLPIGFDFDILYRPDLTPGTPPWVFQIEIDPLLPPRRAFFRLE